MSATYKGETAPTYKHMFRLYLIQCLARLVISELVSVPVLLAFSGVAFYKELKDLLMTSIMNNLYKQLLIKMFNSCTILSCNQPNTNI